MKKTEDHFKRLRIFVWRNGVNEFRLNSIYLWEKSSNLTENQTWNTSTRFHIRNFAIMKLSSCSRLFYLKLRQNIMEKLSLNTIIKVNFYCHFISFLRFVKFCEIRWVCVYIDNIDTALMTNIHCST